MSVDLIKALAPSKPEQSRSEGPVRESEFPKVLDSTLGPKTSSASDSATSKARATEASARPQSEASSESSKSSEAEPATGSLPASGAESGAAEAEEASDAAAEVAGVDLSASLTALPVRESTGVEAEVEGEGRLTDLEARNGLGGSSQQESERGSLDQPIPREIAEELLAEVEARRAGQAVGQNSEQIAAQAAEQDEAPVANRGEVAGGSQAAPPPLDDVVARAAQEGGTSAAENSTPQSSENAREAAGDLRGTESVATAQEAQGDSADPDGRSSSDSGSDRPPEDDPRIQESAAQLARGAEGQTPAEIDANLRAVLANQQGTERAPESAPIDGAGAIANPVAGTASEVTTTATPGTPTPPAASDAIAVQTEWLLSRGGGTARLTLHPKELGEISIRVTLRGDAVDVVMMAQEAATKGIAEDQAERLSQAFSSRDLRMETFEVRRGSAEDLPGGEERFAESGREQGPSQEGENGTPADRRPGASAGTTRPEAGQDIAAMPRIMTVAPETGVDLRI